MSPIRTIQPDWQAPESVRAITTTRAGGVSRPPYDGLNLSLYAGDDTVSVAANREQLKSELALPSVPCWLNQQHGDEVATLDVATEGLAVDGAVTTRPGVVLAVLSADCLPVLLSDRAGSMVAAVHAGWRGLAAGLIARAVALLPPASDLIAWLGPAIGPTAYEVGRDVYAALATGAAGYDAAFAPQSGDRWLVDLPALARRQLHQLGVESVFGGDCCTYTNPDRWFSYRRDGETGRMATLIWLEH